MKVRYGLMTADAWKVQHQDTYEKWVQHLFDKQIMIWHPRHPEQLRFSLLFGGAARVGDYLVQVAPGDIKVISPERFAKEYTVITDEDDY